MGLQIQKAQILFTEQALEEPHLLLTIIYMDLTSDLTLQILVVKATTQRSLYTAQKRALVASLEC